MRDSQSYSEKNDGMVKEQNMSQWREDRMKMSNIIDELESRCKMLVAENRQLEAMMHKCRTEYDVDTAYLKNQVKNERERQVQWKDLYFKAHHELLEVKRQNAIYRHHHHSTSASSTKSVEVVDWRNQRIRSDSGCQECEEERKRKVSESERAGSRHSSSQSLYSLHSPLERISVSTPTMIQNQSRRSPPIEKLPNEEQHRSPGGVKILPSQRQSLLPTSLQPLHTERQSFPVPMVPSQAYKPPDMHIRPLLPPPISECEPNRSFHVELHTSERYLTPASTVMQTDYPSHSSDDGRYLTTDYFVCPECNQSFAHDEAYRHHLTIHVFKCRYCHMNLENEMNYLVHIKCHSESLDNPTFFCYLCDKPFLSVSNLIRHVRSHPDEHPLFQCSECGKQFARKGHLTRHMANHNQSRPYACANCDKTFGHRTHLRRHEIVHSGLRPHQCKVCHQSFSRKSSLSRHYFIHTTEKPFVCPVCEKGFNRKGRLKNHLKIHIREGFPELVNYVIERRPITKEFIEQMNQVDDSQNSQPVSITLEKEKGPEVNSTDPGFDGDNIEDNKEESEESTDEESEDGENEMEGEMSEEICYYQPIKTEQNNNSVYQPIETSETSPREGKRIKVETDSPPHLIYERGSPINI